MIRGNAEFFCCSKLCLFLTLKEEETEENNIRKEETFTDQNMWSIY